MKVATKFIHLLWAGYWSFFLLSVSLPELHTEPYLVALSLLALVWISFAVGLLSDRPWAWFGSFVCSVLWLFGLFYCIWMDIAIMQDEGRRVFFESQAGFFYWELIGAVIAVVVVGALLHTRHQFLRSHEKAV
jgi:hypothetical protein